MFLTDKIHNRISQILCTLEYAAINNLLFLQYLVSYNVFVLILSILIYMWFYVKYSFILYILLFIHKRLI